MNTVIQWIEECIVVTDTLILKINEERAFLVSWNTEQLFQNNQEKEDLINDILERRAKIEAAIKLDGELASTPEFIKAKKIWSEKWNTLRALCIDNKFFIQHSLDNVNLFVENLKKLMTNHKLYTSKGTAAVTQQAGKVVEGTY